MAQKELIAIVGPTAIGKTALSIALAKHFGTEIISADSRQFYKEMCIGTAVPSAAELSEVNHHFIQHISIHDPYTVGDFEREAINRLEQLFGTYDRVIMVGGSGLFIKAVTTGLDKFPEVPPQMRAELNQTYDIEGIEALQKQLKTLDPDYYQQVDTQNPHRLIRALEVCLSSGQPYSSYLNKAKEKRPFKTITIGINAERNVVYKRINLRVDQMMRDGLLEEAKALYPHRAKNALQTVGYSELFSHLDGELDLDTAIEEIKKNSRRFAKRQLTWFKKNDTTLWVDYDETLAELVCKIEDHLKNLEHESL